MKTTRQVIERSRNTNMETCTQSHVCASGVGENLDTQQRNTTVCVCITLTTGDLRALTVKNSTHARNQQLSVQQHTVYMVFPYVTSTGGWRSHTHTHKTPWESDGTVPARGAYPNRTYTHCSRASCTERLRTPDSLHCVSTNQL